MLRISRRLRGCRQQSGRGGKAHSPQRRRRQAAGACSCARRRRTPRARVASHLIACGSPLLTQVNRAPPGFWVAATMVLLLVGASALPPDAGGVEHRHRGAGSAGDEPLAELQTR